jgi:pimeloyl-ACP methyl ester carboxylesterase
VIFFHGLGGHPLLTWQAAKLDEGTLWPQWLAEDIDGHAIWSVGYEAPVSRWQGHAMGLYDRAENILGHLTKEPKLGDGRVILIGHSLGGLVIKQLLEILGQEANNSAAAASLLDRIDKVAFLATPHTGADMAIWGDRLRILVRPSAATMCLVRNDENLRRLNNWYRVWATDIGISHLVLRETKPIRILGTIVKPDAADPALHRVRAWPTDHDHWSIAKPKSRSDEVYVHVKQFVLDQFERPKPRIEKLAEELLSGQQATNSDTQNILSLLKRSEQSADISIAVGKNTFEIVFPNSDKSSPSSDLELPWQSLASAVQPGDYNLLDALRWNYGLVEKLYGRNEELTKIVGWAERDPAPPSARLVTGEGGSGKTRLAAAVANALRERGWRAGFVRSASSLRVTIGSAKGLFLILDYPEENLDLMRALIKMLAVTKSASYPIRLLLLSRRDFRHWEAETIDLEGRFGNHQIADPGDLSRSNVLELIETAATNFAAAAGLPKPRLDRADAWAMEAPLHRLPLFAAAAAVHAVLAPANAFGTMRSSVISQYANGLEFEEHPSGLASVRTRWCGFLR